MKGGAASPLLGSDSMDWRTPPGLIERVQRIRPIELDPCASREGSIRVDIEEHYDDGLNISWGRAGLVYVNPPYGRTTPLWVRKAIHEAAGNTKGAQRVEIVLLTAARPDTQWFRLLREAAQEICFITGRLKFVGAPDPAPFPSAVSYFGWNVGAFRRVFADVGWFVHADVEPPI